MAAGQAAGNHGDEWGLTWYLRWGIYTPIPTWTWRICLFAMNIIWLYLSLLFLAMWKKVFGLCALKINMWLSRILSDIISIWHCQPPFQLACQVPLQTKKTVLDPVDGFHAIPLDDSSKKLTTFITEWDRYRNCWLSQGYLAATDAYTRCNNEIIQDVPNKINIVDNTLLHDNDIDTSFYHTWDYLTLCYTKGIMFNKSKLQFCQDTVNFAGLTITSNGITPYFIGCQKLSIA